MKYKVENFVPVGDDTLVQVLPPHKITTVSRERTPESLVKAAEAQANKEEYVFSEEDIIEKNVKVNAMFRTGKVLIANDKYNIGDIIVFQDGGQIPLDLLTNKVGDEKCPVLVKNYNIKCKLINNE